MSLSPHRMIEAEGRSLAEARRKIEEIARTELPLRLRLVGEHVVSDGREERTQARAATLAEAWSRATAEVPAQAVILERRETALPGSTAIVLDAHDERDARARVEARAPAGSVVTNVVLDRPASKGILGIGRRAPAFRVDLVTPAEVEVRWRLPVKIRAEFADVGLRRRNVAAAWRAVGEPWVTCWFCGATLLREEAAVLEKDGLTQSTPYLERALRIERERIWGENYELAAYDHGELTALIRRALAEAPPIVPICERCVTHRIPADPASQALVLRVAPASEKRAD